MSEIDVSKCEFAKIPEMTRPNGKKTISCEIKEFQGDFFNICANYLNCYYKQLQQLKQENEHLRSDNSMLLAQGDANAFVISNFNFKIQKLQQCLGEIEEICNKYYKSEDELLKIRNKKWLYAFSKGVITGENNVANEVLQLIKQVKEGGE